MEALARSEEELKVQKRRVRQLEDEVSILDGDVLASDRKTLRAVR